MSLSMIIEQATEITSETSSDLDDRYDYIINTLGESEQIPARLNIQDGTALMVDRLRLQYGTSDVEQNIELLKHHLRKYKGISPADKTLWRQWRADFEITGVRHFFTLVRLDIRANLNLSGILYARTDGIKEIKGNVMEFG